MASSEPAYRTISEVAEQIGVPQHVLRFWETRFPQIQPLKRGGNRRYYRPQDIALLTRINRLLHTDGYTIKGVQKLLDDGAAPVADAGAAPKVAARRVAVPLAPTPVSDTSKPRDASLLVAIRARLAAALAEARAL
ncbi:MerR family transcriptional regulator [Polymorphobacter sp. PAMC 29334]|uniref:MerR family transcriptional regulator n=1 Tax=Polymorphobacter sp. PAMC 29334 TaxID=2862331 RepID=UPI001C6747E0|nr:MerR family transcriptional regulator [Polymorphobacter sp. PAMC 29334]QYE33671.1 MerR family transcriptional regulator [Polymorphobacter sp. PAMC 29334]